MVANPAPRLGLALSGGGHRAAYFHIGVLGALAERGLLRQVRVLSTVSGGSLVGALYYLHVKQLLEAKADAEIDDGDYVEIVRTVATEYHAAVAKNLLAHSHLSLGKNVKMALPSYSRTVRTAELLEQHFYRQAWNGKLVGGQIPMRELLIRPQDQDIDPDSHENAARKAPVPILLLESTCLNTGHNWRFEAAYMGEPDRQSDVLQQGLNGDPTDVDKNATLLRSKWDDLPPKLRDWPLGKAVAASAAFPAGFPPMQIRYLYPDMVVELTDGGVHDNQGVEGLVDRGCTHVLVSDGSGQMPDIKRPGTWVPKVLARVVSVYGDAEREQRLLRTFADGNSAFFHLQSGLPNRLGLPGSPMLEAAPRMTTRDFGVDPAVQGLLARVRTNLDAFSDIEAWALAKDGHAIAAHILPNQEAFVPLATPVAGPAAWPWDDVDLANPSEKLLSVLAKGSKEMTLGLFAPLAVMALAAVVAAGVFLHGNGWVMFGFAVAALVFVALYLGPPWRVSAVLFEVLMPLLLAIPLFVASGCLLLAGKKWRDHGRLEPG